MELNSAYNHPVDIGTSFKGAGLTQQHFEKECNIHNIIKKYEKTGYMTDPNVKPSGPPQFGDFSNIQTFHEAQNQLIKAQNAFMSLPSDLRKKFDNDAGKLLQFIENGENRNEAIELGLIPKPEKPKVEPVAPLPT